MNRYRFFAEGRELTVGRLGFHDDEQALDYADRLRRLARAAVTVHGFDGRAIMRDVFRSSGSLSRRMEGPDVRSFSARVPPAGRTR